MDVLSQSLVVMLLGFFRLVSPQDVPLTGQTDFQLSVTNPGLSWSMKTAAHNTRTLYQDHYLIVSQFSEKDLETTLSVFDPSSHLKWSMKIPCKVAGDNNWADCTQMSYHGTEIIAHGVDHPSPFIRIINMRTGNIMTTLWVGNITSVLKAVLRNDKLLFYSKTVESRVSSLHCYRWDKNQNFTSAWVYDIGSYLLSWYQVVDISFNDAGTVVFLPTMSAIDVETGKVLWASDKSCNVPVYYKGTLHSTCLVGVLSYALYSWNATTGKVNWEWAVPNSCDGTLETSYKCSIDTWGNIYVGTSCGGNTPDTLTGNVYVVYPSNRDLSPLVKTIPRPAKYPVIIDEVGSIYFGAADFLAFDRNFSAIWELKFDQFVSGVLLRPDKFYITTAGNISEYRQAAPPSNRTDWAYLVTFVVVGSILLLFSTVSAVFWQRYKKNRAAHNSAIYDTLN